MKGRGEQASSVEIPFEKIQSIEFLSCQTHQCYLAVIHRTLGELKISFDHGEATVRCDASEGSGTFHGRDLANIKRIEFSD